MEQSKMIEFSAWKVSCRSKIKRPGYDIKYFNEAQIKTFRRTVKDPGLVALQKGKVTVVREWMVIDLLISSRIRVAEAADLWCGDCRIGYGQSEIHVRNGKGGKSRTVQILETLKRHLKSFINWKAGRGEVTGEDDYLFMGQRGPWSSQAIQQVDKKWLKALDLYENGKSVHALRHSYAVHYYRKTRDLRGLQKQLGHSTVKSTEIYADVLADDIQQNIKGLWG
jgi:site-specific recombinase XerD